MERTDTALIQKLQAMQSTCMTSMQLGEILDTIPFWIAFETHVMPNFCLLKGNLLIYNELKKHNNKYLSFIYVYKIYCNFCCFSFINLLNHFFLYVGSQVSRSTQIP